MRTKKHQIPKELDKVYEEELRFAKEALLSNSPEEYKREVLFNEKSDCNNTLSIFNGNSTGLTQDQISALQFEYQKSSIQLSKQQAAKYVEMIYKEELNRKRREDSEALLLKKEEIRLKRELITYSIFEDSEGFLYKMIISADEKKIGCKKICTKRNFHLTMFYSSQCPERKTFLLTWDENPKDDVILLSDKNLNATMLGNMLIRRGIHLQTAKEYRKNLLEEVLTHLLKYKEDVELPFSTGWNLVKGEWTYVRPGEPNMKEMFSCMQKN